MNTTVTLPLALKRLIDDGIWPTKENELSQNLDPFLPKSEIEKFAPDEDGLYLYPFPFVTISEDAEKNSYWHDPRNALSEIDISKALVLGDFGLGSDTAIIMDYRSDPPNLLRLQWGETENHWIPLGMSVLEFSDLIIKQKSEQVGVRQ